MSSFIRYRAPGGTFYFVARLIDRRSTLLCDRIGLLRDCTAATRAEYPFAIDCAVVLPSEVQMIWTLPPGDGDYSRRWRHLKAAFSRHLPVPATRSDAQARRGEKGIWQPRFWEHRIRDAEDLATHRHHILSAPVRAGLVARPEDWPHSSIHRDGRAPSPQTPARFPPQLPLGRVETRLTSAAL